MSMKRTKQKSGHGGSSSSDDIAEVFRKAPEKELTWEEHTSGKPDDAFAPYSLKTRFAKGALINHPKFGKGAVVGVEGTTIFVLFQEGQKKLGHAPA